MDTDECSIPSIIRFDTCYTAQYSVIRSWILGNPQYRVFWDSTLAKLKNTQYRVDTAQYYVL